MARKNRKREESVAEVELDEESQAAGGPTATGESTAEAGGTAEADVAEVTAAEAEIAALAAELDEAKDRYLRIAAEFDNFRKRRAREQVDERERAQGQLLTGLLDSLDDLARVAHVDPGQSQVAEVVQGVELVERKLLRQLEIAGLERVGEPEEPFDPNVHEAVASLPAERADQDHTIAAVLQRGYRFHQQLLRPARVQVRIWSGDGS